MSPRTLKTLRRLSIYGTRDTLFSRLTRRIRKREMRRDRRVVKRNILKPSRIGKCSGNPKVSTKRIIAAKLASYKDNRKF